jgi:hypothetical protein
LIRKQFFKNNETVLFFHTGGQPALFADSYANKILESARLRSGASDLTSHNRNIDCDRLAG